MRDSKGKFIIGHKLIPGSEKGWFKKESSPWIEGKKHSIESRIKMSKTHLKNNSKKNLLKNKIYKISCPDCGKIRNKNRQGFLEIKRGIKSKRCFVCANSNKGANRGSFTKGFIPWNAGTSNGAFSDRIKKLRSGKKQEKQYLREIIILV